MIHKTHITFLAITALLCTPATKAMYEKTSSSKAISLTKAPSAPSSPYTNSTLNNSNQLPKGSEIPRATVFAALMSAGSIIVCGPRFWNEFGQHCIGLPKEAGIFIPLAGVATTALCESYYCHPGKDAEKIKKAE